MRLILLLLIPVSITFSAIGQQRETISFSDALKTHLKAYNNQSDIEYEKGDLEKGQFLFDSLVRNYLVGSQFADYSFKGISKRKVTLSEFKKPVFIITYASWCVLNKGEIPALNKLAKQYSKDVEILVLFWDKKENVKKIARQFSGNIAVCYANESYRNDARVVATLKHTLGFPMCYFLNSSLEVVDIKRGGLQTNPKLPFREAMAQNYDFMNQRLSGWLVKKDLTTAQLATSD